MELGLMTLRGACSPHFNGKVERSHRTDKDELYQQLSYGDDVYLEKTLAVWEHFPSSETVYNPTVRLAG